MKQLNILFLFIFHLNIYSQEVKINCGFGDCDWNGCFLQMSTLLKDVALVKFETCFFDNKNLFIDRSVKVKVLEVLKGDIPYDSIYIRGDNGNSMRTPLRSFSWHPTFIMAIYESSPQIYDICACGEFYLGYHCNNVFGIITDNDGWRLDKFERMHIDTLKKALMMPYHYILLKKMKDSTDLYELVEHMPKFVRNQNQVCKLFNEGINFPEKEVKKWWKRKKNKYPIHEFYEYEFIVEKDSTISNFKVKREHSPIIGSKLQEKLNSLKYAPGIHAGKYYRILVTLEIDLTDREIKFNYQFPAESVVYSLKID